MFGIRFQEKGCPDVHWAQDSGRPGARSSVAHPPAEQGIASRILAKTNGGNLTLFAFDVGQGLTEHTSPFDALVIVLEGALTLTIDGTLVRATQGTIVRMPAGISHAVDAPEAARMLLIMLKDRKEA